jgi:hypothetical protein
MSNYIYLKDLKDFPLLDKELFFVDPYRIALTSVNRDKLISNVHKHIRDDILIGWTTRESIAYPRFNLSTYFYNIKTNPKINILPNTDSVLDTEILFDSRSLELYRLSEKYNRVYLFWSGGIDSTLMLSAVLKNWSDTEKLTVVLNHFSIEEHPMFYQTYIKDKLSIVNTDDFFNCKIEFNHDNLYVTGDLGDPLITFDGYDNFDTAFLGIMNMPWKKNIDSIIKYYSANSNKKLAVHTVSQIIKTASEAQVSLETVHDFLWWVNFNWGYDTDLIYMLWQYQDLSTDIDTKTFIEENIFFWFNSLECQNWAVSLSGTDQRNGKYAFKKYIYNFDKDEQYFQYKKKEYSTPKNPQVVKNKQVLAVDTNYNLYYRDIKL